MSDAHLQLREAEELASLGCWSWDLGTGEVTWTPELYRIFRLPTSESPTTYEAYLERVHPEDRDLASAGVRRSLDTLEPFESSYRFVTYDGQTRWIRTRGRVITDGDRAIRMVGVCQDMTDQRAQEQELTRLARQDPLTGLPNRVLFLERLGEAIEALGDDGPPVAVLFIDLDRFKAVNDGYGHAVGDEVLREASRRLLAVTRPGDTVGRMGGDEFAVLCRDVDRDAQAAAMAGRVLETMRERFVVAGRELEMGASIGAAFALSPGTSPEALLRDADAAMYRAKDSGRNRYIVFDRAERARIDSRQRRSDELRDALRRDELRVHYQPVVDLTSNLLVGVEALVRWQHPVEGLVEPAAFIDVAEESGLLLDIDTWVLRQACSEVARWQPPGRVEPTLAVNISPRQLNQPRFADEVAEILDASGLPAGRLCLEITENALMDDATTSIGVLKALRAHGIRVAIDDFGTGYSSLSYLRRFPVDMVKVDRSFVMGLGSSPAADAIVAAVVNLSHALGLVVIAEGIELDTQLVAVRALHCDCGQGYFWSPPVPFEELLQWHLDASRSPRPDPVGLDALLAERTRALRTTTGRTVVLRSPPRLPTVFADLRSVSTVIDHLLSNAVKFSTAETPIVVTAVADRHWVRISVADFGIGMTPDETARSFEQFWQADSYTGDRDSTGIGLYIARSLVEAMGGHIGVKSTRGKGSTFTFALPRSARAAARARGGHDQMPGVSEDSTIREFMRQLGIPNRRGA